MFDEMEKNIPATTKKAEQQTAEKDKRRYESPQFERHAPLESVSTTVYYYYWY